MSQYPNQNSISFLDIVWKYKFLSVFYILGISCLTFFVLYAFNAVPEELMAADDIPDQITADSVTPMDTNQLMQSATAEQAGELPTRLIIKKINFDASISNPVKNDDVTLNNALLHGIVRYPASGLLGKGNVLIFGHSSGLKIVNNQNFKIFNNLKTLSPEDEIIVYSQGKEYVYKVISVTLVDSDKELVSFSTGKNMLTLSTCNVWGQKQERFVVEADFLNVRNRSDL